MTQSTPPPPQGHAIKDGQCICGVAIPDDEAHAHYYHVSTATFSICPADRAPLVMDFSVPQKEWRCPECGEFYAFLGEASHALSTHELALRYVAALKNEPSWRSTS